MCSIQTNTLHMQKADEMIDFLKKFENIRMVLVNHGQADVKEEFAKKNFERGRYKKCRHSRKRISVQSKQLRPNQNHGHKIRITKERELF